MKKKVTGIIAAILLVGSFAGCGKKEVFTCELINEDQGLLLTAENTGKGTAAMSGIDVEEGEIITIRGDFSKGAVTVRLIKPDADEPSVEWECTEQFESDYKLDAGTYNAAFTVTKSGATGTITVEKKNSAASASAADVQNPVMNFVGTYAKDRCSILVECEGENDAKFTVTWGSSAAEHSEWTMSGPFDQETMSVMYQDCVRKNVVFKEDGSVESEEEVYVGGHGVFTFEGNTLTWQDDIENAADGMVFEYAN